MVVGLQGLVHVCAKEAQQKLAQAKKDGVSIHTLIGEDAGPIKEAALAWMILNARLAERP